MAHPAARYLCGVRYCSRLWPSARLRGVRYCHSVGCSTLDHSTQLRHHVIPPRTSPSHVHRGCSNVLCGPAN
eukprot:3432661-Rhodomonas_salina.2